MKKVILAIFVCLLFGVTSSFAQTSNGVKKTGSSKKTAGKKYRRATVNDKIFFYAKKHNLDVRLFLSLIYAESAFKKKARSNKGAACLTQLMPATARRFGLVVNFAKRIDERWNTDKCLDAGAKYLSWLLVKFGGDVRLALAGYNAGEGAVQKYNNRIPPYCETIKYVEKIGFLYYGRSGQGITLSYNQRKASQCVSALYRKWTPRVIKLVPGDSFPVTKTSNNEQLFEPIELDENAVKEKKQAKKRKTTRVVKTPPRLRTQSITFY